jgi:hypothetical protein
VGSKLTVLAGGLITAIALGGAAFADTRPSANDEVKQGIELYKAHKYADAAAALGRAYALDPKLETLFALAQAERLAGDCTNAAAHYHKVIELQSDLSVAKLVQQNLDLCEPKQPEPRLPQPTQPPAEVAPAPAPPPEVITKTVTREVHHTDRLTVALVGSGALALGTGIGLFVAASSDRAAADHAGSLAEHDSLANRSDKERLLGFVVAGSGVALLGVAVFRWVTSDNDPHDKSVMLVPTDGGGAVAVSGRF